MTASAGTLFLARHGSTASRHTYVGWGNPPLDREGAEQAAIVQRMLHEERIDAIYSSPLLRAMQTARPLAAAHQVEIAVRPEMREINYGRYSGRSKYAEPLKLRVFHRYDPMPLGESLFDVYRRVCVFSAELSGLLRSGARIVVVGHFWSNRMLLACLDHVPFERIVEASPYRPATGSILKVICRPEPRGVSVIAACLREEAAVLA
jgi:broad specificity phosphatase PhoE